MANLRIDRSTSRLIGWLTISLAGVLVLLFGCSLVYPTIRAHYLLRQLETLHVGRSTFEEAQALARKLGAKTTGSCDRSFCEWQARVDNSRVPRWWRGAGEGFVVYFDVRDSIVERKGCGFGVGVIGAVHASQVGFNEKVHWRPGNTKEPLQAGWYSTELFRYYNFTVRMTPEVSPADRRRYTAFNYSCFWKYKGCRDARELLPAADPFPESDFPRASK